MAFVLNDRVKETTTTTGTGTINLAGAATGFETFVAGIGNSNVTYYCIAGQGTAEFEVGIGTVTDASPDTLSRTTILSSSNSDSAVNFSAGTKDVFCTLPASKQSESLIQLLTYQQAQQHKGPVHLLREIYDSTLRHLSLKAIQDLPGVILAKVTF